MGIPLGHKLKIVKQIKKMMPEEKNDEASAFHGKSALKSDPSLDALNDPENQKAF